MSNQEYENSLKILMEGTNFEINSESEVLTSSKLRTKTPVEVLNILLGGGLPLSGIYHTWGSPKGGKSTWLYQSMGMFQAQYPNGVCLIVDTESSADGNRLKALGVNPSKVMRLPTTSIESGFKALLKVIKNKQSNKELKDLPLFIIWDTISRGQATDDSSQSRMNAMDRARVIKNYLPQLSAEVEKQPFILGLINQVIQTTDSYGNVKLLSGGGVALQHDNHLSLKIMPKSEEADGSFVVGKISLMSIDKSKVSPEIKNIPLRIDVTKGGVIDPVGSFFEFCIDCVGFFNNGGGWYSLTDRFRECLQDYGDLLNPYVKKYRYGDLRKRFCSDEQFYNLARLAVANYLSSMYSLQSEIMKDYRESILATFQKEEPEQPVQEEQPSESQEQTVPETEPSTEDMQ